MNGWSDLSGLWFHGDDSASLSNQVMSQGCKP
jgi:hypothetical protein